MGVVPKASRHVRVHPEDQRPRRKEAEGKVSKATRDHLSGGGGGCGETVRDQQKVGSRSTWFCTVPPSNLWDAGPQRGTHPSQPKATSRGN